jgi:hypothetical protein
MLRKDILQFTVTLSASCWEGFISAHQYSARVDDEFSARLPSNEHDDAPRPRGRTEQSFRIQHAAARGTRHAAVSMDCRCESRKEVGEERKLFFFSNF